MQLKSEQDQLKMQELKQFIADTGSILEQAQGSVPAKEAAILFSYDQEYAMAIQPHHPDLKYQSHVMRYYSALHRRNIPVEFVREEDDWSGWKLLIAPFQFLMSMMVSVPTISTTPVNSCVKPMSRPSEKVSTSAIMRLTRSPEGCASR